MSELDVQAQRQSRSPLLDCIRAVAIIMVIFFHVAVPYPGNESALEKFFNLRGSKGVDIFFPLSGFLITSFLLQSKRPDFIKVFFLRRVFRIVPLYVVMVTLAGVGMLVTGTDVHLLDRLWVNYTFLTAWVLHYEQNAGAVPYAITWSLSVEEFSYILLGLVALARRRLLPLVLVLLSILPFFLKLWYTQQGIGYYFMPLARIDSIAIGGLAAWLMISGRPALLWLGAALALCYGAAWIDPFLQAPLILIKLALWVAIIMVAIRRWASAVNNPIIAAGANIGFYSYFTYLFHVFVIEAIFLVLEKGGLGYPPYLVVAVLCLALSHVAAILSYRWFEGPVMRWGRRLEGRKPAPERSLPEAGAPATETKDQPKG